MTYKQKKLKTNPKKNMFFMYDNICDVTNSLGILIDKLKCHPKRTKHIENAHVVVIPMILFSEENGHLVDKIAHTFKTLPDISIPHVVLCSEAIPHYDTHIWDNISDKIPKNTIITCFGKSYTCPYRQIVLPIPMEISPPLSVNRKWLFSSVDKHDEVATAMQFNEECFTMSDTDNNATLELYNCSLFSWQNIKNDFLIADFYKSLHCACIPVITRHSLLHIADILDDIVNIEQCVFVYSGALDLKNVISKLKSLPERTILEKQKMCRFMAPSLTYKSNDDEKHGNCVAENYVKCLMK